MKRQVKKSVIVAGVIFVVLVVLAIIGFKTYAYYTGNEYKLSKIGYNEKEVANLLKLDKKVIDKALTGEYNKDLIPLVTEKYFIWDYYNDYLAYIKKAKEETHEIDYSLVVAKVNTKTNYPFYTNIKETDMTKDYAILVNKYYHLPEKYTPKDIVNVSNWHAFEGVSLREEVYTAFKEMFVAAKKDGITLIINSGYRSYDYQSKLYNSYLSTSEEYADTYVARPDYSEHQAGLAVDITTYGANKDNFDSTDTFKWLNEHSYKYGFILRYPKDKEEITGYIYEPWHYRYLGAELANKVKKSSLTYEEYYAYYLER